MKIISSLVLFISCHMLVGQTIAFDSILFDKVRMMKGEYVLNHNSLSNIVLKSAKPIPYNKQNIKPENRVAESIWTLLTGISSGSMTESAWVLHDETHIQAERFQFPTMVMGAFHRDRERVRDEEGNQSLETTETIDLYWNEGAWGWIIQGADTLGDFNVEIRKTPKDSLKRWETYTEKNISWLKSKLKKYGVLNNSYDFLIQGTINNRSFTLIYNGQYFRQALISEDQLIGLWQDKPYVVMLSKKHRIHPYLLIQEDISLAEKKQILFLLSLGQTIARNIQNIY